MRREYKLIKRRSFEAVDAWYYRFVLYCMNIDRINKNYSCDKIVIITLITPCFIMLIIRTNSIIYFSKGTRK